MRLSDDGSIALLLLGEAALWLLILAALDGLMQ